MAERCSQCGSADTSTGGANFSCLICGAVTAYDGLTEQRVPGQPAPTAVEDPEPEPVPEAT